VFYNQPLAVRFGTEFLRHVDQVDHLEPYWDSLDIAVAWVRASGMAHLSDRLANFLRSGGHVSVVVGIDIQNTTHEGLQALLDLEGHGHCETFVYHNEASGVFHPKLYLFRNEEEARLIVGSNNITQSGLYVNVEAGLQIDTAVDSSVVGQALDALSSWKDTTSRLAVRLDPAFLAQLVADGYVIDEARAQANLRATRGRRAARIGPPLFGARPVVPPPLSTVPARQAPAQRRRSAAGASVAAVPAASPPGTVLLMRLRKASQTTRTTQTQIPIRVADTFFHGVAEVTSAHSGQRHGIHVATARGGRNTMKLEIPEMADFTHPVARFERTPQGVVYQTYDEASPEGHQIMTTLKAGRTDNTTQLSISDADRATWWRPI
jgi:hypothetical protein